MQAPQGLVPNSRDRDWLWPLAPQLRAQGPTGTRHPQCGSMGGVSGPNLGRALPSPTRGFTQLRKTRLHATVTQSPPKALIMDSQKVGRRSGTELSWEEGRKGGRGEGRRGGREEALLRLL